MKVGLPAKVLRAAAESWRRTHPPPKTPPKELKDVDPKAPYAELWNGLKRSILRECGLDVLRAPAERIYFEEPRTVDRGQAFPYPRRTASGASVCVRQRRTHVRRTRTPMF